VAVSDAYQSYVLEQLESLGRVTATRMFGGVGLYHDGAFFALIAHDTLYFKVDDHNRADYERADMKPFQPYVNRSIRMGYYEVPADVLEDPDQLAIWATKALAAATRSAAARDIKGRPSRR